MHDHATATPHAHAVGLDALLAFLNTLEYTDGVPVDAIATDDAAAAFLAGLDLAHEADLKHQAARDGDAWLSRLRELRAALREVFDAQVGERTPQDGALDLLNGLLARAPRVELRATPDGVAVAHRHLDTDPTGEALARAAIPLVEAIAAGQTSRFRICANDGCRWVFEDASRAGRRRWCDMTTCGNRDKVRRYRSRHRDASSEAVPRAD